MGSYLMLFRSVLTLLFIEATTCNFDQINRDACQKFIAAKHVKDLIEVKGKLIPTCPCLKQQIDLDYSFEKVGDCYRSWFFENGVKQMCCYSSNGNLLTGAPHGGYMLFEDQWRNMADIKRSCCLDDYTCQLFYDINPSDDCSSYKPPITVTSLGDPNIQTIDGHKFDFNGHGEYVFLKTSDLEIQVRLGYVIPGNNDSTLFEAFAIFDRTSRETFEVYFNRSTKKLSVYKNGTVICNSTGGANRKPCEPPKTNHCMVQTDGTMIAIVGCGVQPLARQIVFTPGEFMDVSMMSKTPMNSMNITGLAGRQRDGKYIFRNGTELDTNSTRILFDYGESWSLRNESESHFTYSLTGGNFTYYNEPHTRPRFLEDLVGNLTALFQGYPGANISLFNATCRNDWDNRPNEECLLTIARTKQLNLGVAVLETMNEEHLKWEQLHNKSPYFLGNLTDNITAVYKQEANITIDLKQYVSDDQPVNTLSFKVETKLPEEEFSLVNGVFIWNVGTGLRYSNTSITFFVTDRLNASDSHNVAITYCGCNDPSECDFKIKNTMHSSDVTKAECKCPKLFRGLYCEKKLDPCDSYTCYQNKCNKSFENSGESWPCAPCPKGTEEQIILKKQTCTDIDECAEGYISPDKCEHNCNNTDGSFICSCKNGGYKLNSNKYSCDDIDECEQKTAKCKEENTYCQNTLGSYMCLCSPGYENKTGTCKKSEGQKYVGTMDIVIALTQENAVHLNETINTEENKQTFQKILDKGFNGTQGYQSVEVLSIMITSTSRLRRDAEKKIYNLKVDYVVTWAKNETVDGTKSTALSMSFQNSNHNQTLTFESESIDLNTATLSVKSGNKSGVCSFLNLINCDISSTRCVDVPGSFKCECRQGFVTRGSNVYCADVDECKDRNHCSGHGTCKNRYGGFTCDCVDGFSLNDTDKWNQTCDDIDECNQEKYTCYQGYCSNTMGGWDCTCNETGFIRKNISTGFICSDIDECSNGSYICKDGNCKNSVGDWSCTCEPGYNKIGSATNVTCIDVDECKDTNSHNCSGHGTCKNRNGGFTCDCEDGFSLNDTDEWHPTCDDIDECKSPEKYTCYQGDCNNTIGGWDCICNATGYIKNKIGSGFICSDIDECSNGSYICKDGNCKNSVGDWSCTCEPGYIKETVSDTNVTCIDIDECSNGSYICKDGNCKNSVGDWSCTCEPGYNKTGSATNVTCIDVDECKDTNSHNCSGHGTCKNRNGGFTCYCEEGFSLNDTDEWHPTCDDIDECKSPEKYTCYQGDCNNTIGGWDCTCNETGFIKNKIGSGFICSDIDECSNGSYICKDGNCKNSVGAWSCTCEPGYTKETVSDTNVTCIDINECDQFKTNETDEERCVHGECENKPGSWACNCPRNRIRQNIGNSSYAVYRCQGDYQYIGQLTLFWTTSNVSKKSVDIFLNKTITELFRERYNVSITPPKGQPSMRDIFLSVEYLNATYQDLGGAVKANALYVLHLGETVTSEWVDEIQSKTFNQTKPFIKADGGQVTVIASTILNETGINLCNIHYRTNCDLTSTTCNVHNGSFSCDCKSGFSRIDDQRCKDIDECKEEKNLTPCSNGGTCVNSPGNWTCECPPGYEPSYINETFIDCSDIDECNRENTCSNGGSCINTQGNWTCECPPGFETKYINNTFINCSDIDECKDKRYSCKGERNSSSCVNMPGDWDCDCTSGYQPMNKSETERVCIDINECETSKTSCIQAVKCENTIGNWTCKCGEGQTEKTINVTSRVCAGEYQYVASVSFTLTSNGSPPNSSSLETAIKNQVLDMYKETFKDYKVWVEILNINELSDSPSSRRKRRSLTGNKRIKAEYIVHFDKQVTKDQLDKVDDNHKSMEIKVDNVTLKLTGIETKDNSAICKTKNNNCNKTTSICKSDTGKIECQCKEGYHKDDVSPLRCEAEKVVPDSDQQTTLIAVGSSLSGLVVILCGVIFGVLRWKRKKIKEAKKIEIQLQDLNSSFRGSQYLTGSFSEGGSLHEHRFSNIAIPRVRPNGDARSLNGHVPGNLYTLSQKPPRPHYMRSLPDLTNDDVAIYPSHNRRLSDQYPARYFSHERNDFTRSHDTINDSGQFSPILDYRRQVAPNRPRSPRPDYGRFNENKRSRSPNPDYRWDGRQERSNDSGVGNGYSSDSNEYRRTEQRGGYPIPYRYSDTRF